MLIRMGPIIGPTPAQLAGSRLGEPANLLVEICQNTFSKNLAGLWFFFAESPPSMTTSYPCQQRRPPQRARYSSGERRAVKGSEQEKVLSVRLLISLSFLGCRSVRLDAQSAPVYAGLNRARRLALGTVLAGWLSPIWTGSHAPALAKADNMFGDN